MWDILPLIECAFWSTTSSVLHASATHGHQILFHCKKKISVSLYNVWLSLLRLVHFWWLLWLLGFGIIFFPELLTFCFFFCLFVQHATYYVTPELEYNVKYSFFVSKPHQHTTHYMILVWDDFNPTIFLPLYHAADDQVPNIQNVLAHTSHDIYLPDTPRKLNLKNKLDSTALHPCSASFQLTHDKI